MSSLDSKSPRFRSKPSPPVQVKTSPCSRSRPHRQRNSPLEQPAPEIQCSSYDRSFCDLSETLEEDSLEIECGLGLPKLKLIMKIVSQVEYYLSDDNLSKDPFLLKHVLKTKMGFVSIKLLTSFKKVKHLTRDWRTTLHALNYSDILEINDEGTKVRRTTPVPQSLLGVAPLKLLLAWNILPEEHTSSSCIQNNIMEVLTKTFAPYGVIESIRILKPGKEVPSNMKKHLVKYPELNTKSCALIEYENLESAINASEELKLSLASGGHINVVLLTDRVSRKKNGDEKEELEDLEKKNGDEKEELEDLEKKNGDEKEELEDLEIPNKKTTKKHTRGTEKLKTTLEDLSLNSSSESDSAPASPVFTTRLRSSSTFSNGVICSPGTLKPSSFSSPHSSSHLPRKFVSHQNFPSPLAAELVRGGCSHLASSPEMRRFVDYSSDGGLGSGSPWVKQRKAAAYNQFKENGQLPLNTLAGVSSCFLSSRVLRLPYGPDGTKGFYNSIGRGKLVLQH